MYLCNVCACTFEVFVTGEQPAWTHTHTYTHIHTCIQRRAHARMHAFTHSRAHTRQPTHPPVHPLATTLHGAAENGHLEVVKLLLTHDFPGDTTHGVPILKINAGSAYNFDGYDPAQTGIEDLKVVPRNLTAGLIQGIMHTTYMRAPARARAPNMYRRTRRRAINHANG